MPPVAFEPTISAGERPQTYASDCAATGTGNERYLVTRNSINVAGIWINVVLLGIFN